MELLLLTGLGHLVGYSLGGIDAGNVKDGSLDQALRENPWVNGYARIAVAT